MVRFTLTREGSLFRDLIARAREARPVLRQWGAYLKAGAKADFAEKAPPLAASTLKKQASTYTGAVTKQATIRSSAARKLDATLKRKGSEAARDDLRRLLAGDMSRGTSGNRTVDRLRRRLETAKRAKAAGMNIASGKSKLDRSGGERGGKMGKAFKAIIRRFSVIVENSVKYSGVHDKGGTVGNGANLPAWNFMNISAKARAELADIALRWLIKGD